MFLNTERISGANASRLSTLFNAVLLTLMFGSLDNKCAFLKIGITENVKSVEAKRIYFVNALAVLCIAASIFMIVPYIIYDLHILAWVCILFSPIYLLCFNFNQYPFGGRGISYFLQIFLNPSFEGEILFEVKFEYDPSTVVNFVV